MLTNTFSNKVWPCWGAVVSRLHTTLRNTSVFFQRLTPGVWRKLRSIPPLYLGLIILTGYAAWEGHTPVTVITPFQVPNAPFPFTGDIAADAVQDALKSIRNQIDEEKRNPNLRSSDMGLPDMRNMLIPEVGRVQAPPRFSVEVKGVSYERILSIARAVMGTETAISGDVVLNGKEFSLVARSGSAGPWESVPSPISADGLKRASRDLAKKILASQDPTLAGVALLKEGQVDQGLIELSRALGLNPTDPRLKLNLCMGFGTSRRYDEAIECYKDVLKMNPSSAQEVSKRLARVYYLKGYREKAIQLYEELRKQGYRDALLGLGEALDDSGHAEDALEVYDAFLSTERLNRKRAIAHVKRGAALAHLGRHEEALAEYQEALKYAPRDLLILVNKGIELAEAVDMSAGIAQIQSAVDENKNADAAPFALLQLGLLVQKTGDWQSACDQFRSAAQLQPNYVEAHLRLAHALVHLGRNSEAREEYNTVAKLSASDLERGYSQIFAAQWLGNDLRDLGNYSAAAAAYRQAIRLKPDYSAAHCQLGLALARQGYLDSAIREYGAALLPAKLKELNDTDCLAMAQRQLGEMLAAKGHPRNGNVVIEARTTKRVGKANSQSAAARNIPGQALNKYGQVGKSL